MRSRWTIIITYFTILMISLFSSIAYFSLKNALHKDTTEISDADQSPEYGPPDEPELQRQLKAYINQLKTKGMLSKEDTVAFYVFDIAKRERVAGFNENESLQAASMIKPFIALAFFHQVKYGGLVYTEFLRRRMEAMLRQSNNYSANQLIKTLGGPAKVQEILEKNYGIIFPETKIVEYIPAGGKTYLNRASMMDYSRFLYCLWNEILPSSREILRIMSLENRDVLCRRVNGMPSDTCVYDKTGSTGYVTGDMGIIEAKDRKGNAFPYIIACVIQGHNIAANYTSWHRKTETIIREISSIVYLEMKKRHESM